MLPIAPRAAAATCSRRPGSPSLAPTSVTGTDTTLPLPAWRVSKVALPASASVALSPSMAPLVPTLAEARLALVLPS